MKYTIRESRGTKKGISNSRIMSRKKKKKKSSITFSLYFVLRNTRTRLGNKMLYDIEYCLFYCFFLFLLNISTSNFHTRNE